MAIPRRQEAAALPLQAGDVLPALQLAAEHGHEDGWAAVRLARPNTRPFTGVRLPRRHTYWRDFVVVSRVADGAFRAWSIPADALVLVRHGSDHGTQIASNKRADA